LDTAQAVITKNRNRREKKLWTERDGGDQIRVWVAENERHEGEMVATEIRKALQTHEFPDYKEFVILYRTNAQSRSLEEVFMRYGIPYKIVGGIRFYERKEIKDLLAYLRVIANYSDSVSLMRIINVPARQIGPKTLEYLQDSAHMKDITFFEAMERVDEIQDIPESKREKVKAFTMLMKRLILRNRDTTVSGLIKFIMEEAGYKKFLDDGTVEGEARLENAQELISVAAKYDKLEAGMSLNVFLEEVALISDLDSVDEKDNAVTFMTLHSAKGLEFSHVFICGLEEGLLPHSRSALSPQELEEERRLFYVGCTRAMNKLFLLYTKNRMLYGESQYAMPSQFLADLPINLVERNDDVAGRYFGGIARKVGATPIGGRPVPTENYATSGMVAGVGAAGADGDENAKRLPEFHDGDKVMHRTFGIGMVISVTGGIVTVAFKDPTVGIKKLAIAIAPMEKV
jgi:DNA helicase-2/ATP-dependent DNA helicase PcrA